MNKKKNGDEASLKWGRHPKESRKSHCVMVRFDNEEWQKFLAMYEKSGVYARAVFLKAHFFGQPFRVLVTDRTLLDYCTNLSAFHAQYRMVGTTTIRRSGSFAAISRKRRRWHCSTVWKNARRNWSP